MRERSARTERGRPRPTQTKPPSGSPHSPCAPGAGQTLRRAGSGGRPTKRKRGRRRHGRERGESLSVPQGRAGTPRDATQARGSGDRCCCWTGAEGSRTTPRVVVATPRVCARPKKNEASALLTQPRPPPLSSLSVRSLLLRWNAPSPPPRRRRGRPLAVHGQQRGYVHPEGRPHPPRLCRPELGRGGGGGGAATPTPSFPRGRPEPPRPGPQAPQLEGPLRRQGAAGRQVPPPSPARPGGRHDA